MSNDVYRKLAKVLDTLPNGFPATESGLEIKLLQKIFTPEEADLFCDLRLSLETPVQIAERTGRSHLMAFVSADDGKTWSGGLLLDDRSGVSYPDGPQMAHGRIRIIYDASRTGARHILMATVRATDPAAAAAKTKWPPTRASTIQASRCARIG